jgi:hypothetical protein
MQVWATGMPWKAINAAIDNSTFEYAPGEEARRRWEAVTHHHWDNLSETYPVKIPCPRCRRDVDTPWSTCDNRSAWTGENPGETGSGYADAGFLVRCGRCTLQINHDILRTEKFRNDMQMLMLDNTPMPGTFLSVTGLTWLRKSKLVGLN